TPSAPATPSAGAPRTASRRIASISPSTVVMRSTSSRSGSSVWSISSTAPSTQSIVRTAASLTQPLRRSSAVPHRRLPPFPGKRRLSGTSNVSHMVLPLTPDDPPALGGFRLAGRLGEGGQGVVYLAHSPSGEAVAVKVLTRVDPESRARLARELHALESRSEERRVGKGRRRGGG